MCPICNGRCQGHQKDVPQAVANAAKAEEERQRQLRATWGDLGGADSYHERLDELERRGLLPGPVGMSGRPDPV